MRRETAEVVAMDAAVWMVEADLMGAFLTETGTDAAALRAALTGTAPDEAGETARGEALAATLDFLLQRDDWVRGAAAAANVEPGRMMEARAALPGGTSHHWT